MLLRMLAGLKTPTSGSIHFDRDGDDVTDMFVQDRRVGTVFQNTGLFPCKTVPEEHRVEAKVPDASKEERRERTWEIVVMPGIGEMMDDMSNQLSDGQRQRVALGGPFIRGFARDLVGRTDE